MLTVTDSLVLAIVTLLMVTSLERRGSVVVSTSAWHAAGRWFDSRTRHVSLLGVAMDTEPYPVVAGLLIRKAVTW